MKRKKIWLTGIILISLVATLSLANTEIKESLQVQETAHVIIQLADTEVTTLKTLFGGILSEEEEIRERQHKVLTKLRTKDFLWFKKEFTLNHQYKTLNTLAGAITAQGLEKMEKDKNIRAIAKDEEVSIVLADSIHQISANSVHDLGFKGKHQTICILDTGIDYTHPALGGCTPSAFTSGTCQKVIGGFDFINKDNNPIDDHGHGTHVAGIAAADQFTFANRFHSGVAPEASLAALKILDSRGSGTFSGVLAGMDWCIDNAKRLNISVISMSLGSASIFSDPEICKILIPSVSAAVDKAIQNNISVAAAAGNSGSTEGINMPACLPNATSVGSIDKNDRMSRFTDRQGLLDVVAPGQGILSTKMNGGYVADSGTSMATPHVAGAFVLLRQANSALNPRELRHILNSTGTPIADEQTNLSYPKINVQEALFQSSQSFNLTFQKGWNLASFPLLAASRSLPGPFVAIANQTSHINFLIPANNSWTTFSPGNVVASSAHTFNPAQGFWIKAKEPVTLLLYGLPFSDFYNIPLSKGWNLMAYTSLRQELINETLQILNYTQVYTMKDNVWVSYTNGRDTRFNSLTTLQPGNGYLIYMNENANFTLP